VSAEAKPTFALNVTGWEIPLRYYRGWTVVFSVASESFSCPLLCLFNFSNSRDLERAIDKALECRAERGSK
jgi:hypothetical protein